MKQYRLQFYKNGFFYLFLFNSYFFYKIGLFQQMGWRALLAIFLLGLQLYVAFTTTSQTNRVKLVFLILSLLLLALFLISQ